MNLNIDHYPNKNFKVFSFTPVFTIDLNQSVKERLKAGEVLTNATAIKIFKQIKLQSDILSFLTKPIVLISLGASIFLAGLLIPATGLALGAARVLVCALGGGILGFSIENYFLSSFLSQISEAYADQSKRAAEYIKKLEASNQEFVFALA